MSLQITILLGGDVEPTDVLRDKVAVSYVIAADGGLRHAASLSLKPDLLIGDFDSVDDALLADYADVSRQSHPPLKHISDGELAIEHAVSLKPSSIILCGALGGARADHAIFNALCLLRYAQLNPQITFSIEDGSQSAFPIFIGADNQFDMASGSTFSILPFNALSGLSITGAQWPLDEVEVPMGSTITLSNVATKMPVIRLQKGSAIMMVQNQTT